MVLEDWSVEDLDNLLRGYRSIMDFLAAIHAEKLYRAYPDAKFILVRPPIQISRDILRLDMKTKYRQLATQMLGKGASKRPFSHGTMA